MTHEEMALPGFEEVDAEAWASVRRAHGAEPRWSRRVHILPENELYVVVGESVAGDVLVQDRVWVAQGRIGRHEHTEVALGAVAAVAGNPPVLRHRDPATGTLVELAVSPEAAEVVLGSHRGQLGGTSDLA